METKIVCGRKVLDKNYANRTQAEKVAKKVGGKVFHPSLCRIFYVEVK